MDEKKQSCTNKTPPSDRKINPVASRKRVLFFFILQSIVLNFGQCKGKNNKRIEKRRIGDLMRGCLRHILFNFAQ